MDLPHLDESVVEMLREVMGGDFGLLINTFVGDLPVRLSDLNTCLSRGDISGMEKPAHTLKGSSANMGAKLLSFYCSELVQQIRNGSVTDASRMVANIEQESNTVLKLLEGVR